MNIGYFVLNFNNGPIFQHNYYNFLVLSSDVLPVELTHGLSIDQGIVKVFYGGVNGLVCGDGWSLNNANVVCKQLGYSEAVKATATLISETDLEWYWIGDVECNGNEPALFDCPSSGFGNADCSSNAIAMVTCGGVSV